MCNHSESSEVYNLTSKLLGDFFEVWNMIPTLKPYESFIKVHESENNYSWIILTHCISLWPICMFRLERSHKITSIFILKDKIFEV